MGLGELAEPINVPIGLTVKDGSVPDAKHFEDTYRLSSRHVREGSMFVFDKGPNSQENLRLVQADKMKYLTAKKLNKSDEKRMRDFDRSKATLVDAAKGIYGIKYYFPSRIDYFYFSESLKENQLKTKERQAERKLEEAKLIQKSIDDGRGLPKSFQIRNVLVDVKYSYQTKLCEISDDEALRLLYEDQITGREGFFCLRSTENLPLQQALATYRQKDSIEKIFHSLKNEIEIKPLRVWRTNSIYGVLLVGFLAQLFISLIRYEHMELKHIATKFIKNSLSNLTVTVEYLKDGRKRHIYSNYDPLNRRIFGLNQAVT
jgi:transposase